MTEKNYRVLIVDDETSVLLLLERIISDEGYEVRSASNGKEALEAAEKFSPHLIITDLKMPVMGGIELIERYKEIDRDTDFMVLTAYGTIDTAVKSMKMGAIDYILKPLKEPDELRIAIKKAFDRRRLIDENTMLKLEHEKDIPPVEIIFAGMEELLEDITSVAPTDSTVLLLGETGTGKNLVARVVHTLSQRKGAFVEVNCASVPDDLLESEFFGHEKGAFTGALAAKKGKFEFASSGTIFLDEISEMDPRLQAKLLRVLQDGMFERLGGNTTLRTNARIICATNRDVEKEVSEGRFREDLYFRLNVFPLRLKPLRERTSQLPVICDYLVKSISARIGKKVSGISEGGMKHILSYDWPGNIREFQNVLERSIILSKSDMVDIPGMLSGEAAKKGHGSGTLDEIEKRAIEDALIRTSGNRRKAAELLGISLRSLQYKIKGYGQGK